MVTTRAGTRKAAAPQRRKPERSEKPDPLLPGKVFAALEGDLGSRDDFPADLLLTYAVVGSPGSKIEVRISLRINLDWDANAWVLDWDAAASFPGTSAPRLYASFRRNPPPTSYGRLFREDISRWVRTAALPRMLQLLPGPRPAGARVVLTRATLLSRLQLGVGWGRVRDLGREAARDLAGRWRVKARESTARRAAALSLALNRRGLPRDVRNEVVGTAFPRLRRTRR